LARGCRGEHHAPDGQTAHPEAHESKEARIVAEEQPPTNNGVPEERPPARTSTCCSTSPSSRSTRST
jgi:hypothetical protein